MAPTPVARGGGRNRRRPGQVHDVIGKHWTQTKRETLRTDTQTNINSARNMGGGEAGEGKEGQRKWIVVGRSVGEGTTSFWKVSTGWRRKKNKATRNRKLGENCDCLAAETYRSNPLFHDFLRGVNPIVGILHLVAGCYFFRISPWSCRLSSHDVSSSFRDQNFYASALDVAFCFMLRERVATPTPPPKSLLRFWHLSRTRTHKHTCLLLSPWNNQFVFFFTLSGHHQILHAIFAQLTHKIHTNVNIKPPHESWGPFPDRKWNVNGEISRRKT